MFSYLFSLLFEIYRLFISFPSLSLCFVNYCVILIVCLFIVLCFYYFTKLLFGIFYCYHLFPIISPIIRLNSALSSVGLWVIFAWSLAFRVTRPILVVSGIMFHCSILLFWCGIVWHCCFYCFFISDLVFDCFLILLLSDVSFLCYHCFGKWNGSFIVSFGYCTDISIFVLCVFSDLVVSF